MPPRNRFALDDLTDEELDELSADFGGPVALASLPRPRAQRPAPISVDIGDAVWLDDIDPERIGIAPGEDDGWLDDLMERPPQTPARPQLSAVGPGGTFASGGFTGDDTPQARALIQQRGMQVTTPPSDDELLDPSAFERPAKPLDLGEDDGWLDDLIAQQSAAMDREQAPSAPAPQRRSREAELDELYAPPTRGQGFAAILGDALFGGNNVDRLNQRARTRENMLAQARMQDVAAGERADQQAADRELSDARIGATLRGQDLADARAGEARNWQREQFERTDQRIREEGAESRKAAGERAALVAGRGARNEAPQLTPDQERAGLAGYLSEQANTSEAEAAAYLAGKTDGIAPGKLERLRATDNQVRMLSSTQRGELIKGGLGRSGADRDRKEPEKLEARNFLREQHAAIKAATDAWKALKKSPTAQQVIARVGGGDSTFASLTRSALLSPEEQAQAAQIQSLANALIKAQSGASVTANEWRRVAKEVGLPEDAFSVFNSPSTIDAWLQKSVEAFRRLQESTLATYRDLYDDVEQ